MPTFYSNTGSLPDDSIQDYEIDWGTGSFQVSQDDVVDGLVYKQYNPANVLITGGSITGVTGIVTPSQAIAYAASL
jgi:hypothetical protein